MQKKYRFFKKFSPFYRNSSVTKSPKTLQLCCASRQNKSSATASAHFLGHFGAFRFVYRCIYMHRFAYRGFCVRFCGASLCSLLRSFPVEQIGAAVQWLAQQLLYKKHKKEAAAQKCATASHNSGYAIEQCSGTGDHRAAFAGFCAIFRDKNAKNSKIGPFRIATQVQLHLEVSPFPVTFVLHFECIFWEVQHIFVLSLTFLSKVRLVKIAYHCIFIHLIAYCAFFAFPVHKKRHRALHFCKARCPRFDRFPVSSSLPEPSSGSVRSGPGSWCCGTRTAYRPDVQ